MFYDASTKVYTAVVYVREKMDDRVHTQRLTAKRRVAPIKTLCVPGLELCAALLGAQLSQAVKAAINDSRFPHPKSLLRRIHKWPSPGFEKFRASFHQKIGSLYQRKKIQMIVHHEEFQLTDFLITNFGGKDPIGCVKTSSFGPHWMLHLLIAPQLTV